MAEAFARELCGPDDVLADFMMREYLNGPRQPTLRPANVLYCLLEQSAYRDRWRAIVDRLREALGPNRTVWGAKHGERGIDFELYFYCYDRSTSSSLFRMLDPEMFARVRRALDGIITITPPEHPAVKMIMFSIDVDDDVLKRGSADTYHLYLGGGYWYDIDGTGVRHMNSYEFFETGDPTQDESIDLWIRSRMVHAQALRPEWADLVARYKPGCRRFWLGVKPLRDAFYFNQIPTSRLVEFLREWRWPARLVREIDDNAALYEDVKLDVGLDFRTADGGLRWERSAIYGVI